MAAVVLSLGDWQDKGKEKQSLAKMALHYSAARRSAPAQSASQISTPAKLET